MLRANAALWNCGSNLLARSASVCSNRGSPGNCRKERKPTASADGIEDQSRGATFLAVAQQHLRGRAHDSDQQLTIIANNSSMSDVLMAVRAATGADVDLPGGVSGERVTAQLGPGPARKVLSDLLGWSSYDYIIQGSDTDPLAIQSVILMVRTKSASGTTTGTAIDVPNRHSPGLVGRQVPDLPSTTTDIPEAQVTPEQSAPAPAPAATPDEIVRPSETMSKAPVASGASMGSNSGKSTEEMIQDMQQMYQQRRMLQQQQNQGANSGQKSPPGN
jgi:hypothetical protein